MLGLRHEEIRLEPYDEQWSRLFAEEKERLSNALGSAAQIYHIGSTAIRGALAKPILDIAVGIEDLAAMNIPAIETLGYTYRGELGIKGRKYFIKKKEELTTHHLHCYPADHPALKDALQFCRYLNDHPEWVKLYVELKRRLAAAGITREQYTEGKTEFVQQVLALAREDEQADIL